MNKTLTKYPFQKGTQCTKSIWLNYFKPELKSAATSEQQLVMDKGKDVGVFARNLFPGGVDLSKNETVYGKKLLEETQIALQTDEQIFYEAAFQTLDGSMNFKADLFVRCERNTKLIEVKSSTSIKAPQHIIDLAFQYYVLKHSSYVGPPIEVYMVYINNEYVREEAIDIDQLFVIENVTRRIIDAQILIKNYLRQFSIVLEEGKKCPTVSVSEACFKPYGCSFFEHCWKDMPRTTVFNISRMRKSKAAKMIEQGIIEPHQIPKDTKLSVEQWTEVNAARTGKASINKKEIKAFLNLLELNSPTFWMDFETYMPPIPEYPGTRPYQQMCFQYCVLYRTSDGKINRREFLAERGNDPRKAFIKQLLEDTEGEGNIIVYNQAFEIARMRELAKEFPQYEEEISQRINRIKDLYDPFAKRHYYHPLMNGSASIKTVLNVLVGTDVLSYENLSIKNGAIAMGKYEKFQKLPLQEQIETRRALLEYCHVDCLGMVKIVEALENLCNQ
jgi:hypothetical protein